MDYPLLDALTGPDDLKSLDGDGLLALADELRRGLIQTISRVGGHFAPNLGVIELTLALYKVFDVPRDKVIWDVGHQCYPHKMLTGRWKQLPTIKQFGGISGFLRRDESPYDVWGRGPRIHQFVRRAGFAKARDLKGRTRRSLPVIGDGRADRRHGAGSLAERRRPQDRRDVRLERQQDEHRGKCRRDEHVPCEVASPAAVPARRAARQAQPQGNLACCTTSRPGPSTPPPTSPRRPTRACCSRRWDCNIFGPIDGHDLPFLVDVFEHVKHIRGPVLVHILTTKGKGYDNAEQDSRNFHAVTPFTVEDGKFEKKATGVTFTQAFTETLNEVAETDKSVVAITAAMPDGTGWRSFKASSLSGTLTWASPSSTRSRSRPGWPRKE
jgi:1-deoxy-D-xylulose-5-phosphate synthase